MAATLPRVSKMTAKLDWRMLFLLPIPLLVALAAHLGYFKVAEDVTLSWRYRVRGEREAPIKVVYVDIDSRSISDLKNFPWPRSYFAQVSKALLETGHARAIGVDTVFSESGLSPAYDLKRWIEANREFGRFLQSDPPVVFAASYSAVEYRDADGLIHKRELPVIARGLPALDQISTPELPELSFRPNVISTPKRVALIDTLDGGTQWVPLYVPTSTTISERFDHMGLALALLYWRVDPSEVKVTADYLEVPRTGAAPVRIPLTRQQFVEINWFSHWLSPVNPRASFSVVLGYALALESGTEEQKTAAQAFFAEFKDAVVLIGPVDPLLQDLAPTAFDAVPVPKVGVHGNFLKTVISGQFLRRLPDWSLYILCAGLGVMVTGFSVIGGARGLWSKGAALLLLLGYAGAAFLLFSRANLVLPLTAPLAAAFAMAFAGIAWQLIVEEKQKGRIKGMFGAYVSPELVERMVESKSDPKLGGHDDEITAYFSDIQSFSSFSEKLGSGPLVELMNEYLTACTDIVQSEGGTLDKYIGDAVVAMFGAPIPLPDHAYRACLASQKVHLKLMELRTKWKAETGKWPPIVHNMQTRIGLNSGICMIGNMGSRTRFNYTMMGDNVNLAARMESGAKSWGAYTMCTEATKLACEQHGGDRIVFRSLARIVVKGRQQAVPVYEVVGLKEHVTPRTRECVAAFEAALAKYYARDWQGALTLLARSRELEPNQPGVTPGVSSNPSLVYLEHIVPEAMAEPPAADWDGRYIMKEK